MQLVMSYSIPNFIKHKSKWKLEDQILSLKIWRDFLFWLYCNKVIFPLLMSKMFVFMQWFYYARPLKSICMDIINKPPLSLPQLFSWTDHSQAQHSECRRKVPLQPQCMILAVRSLSICKKYIDFSCVLAFMFLSETGLKWLLNNIIKSVTSVE